MSDPVNKASIFSLRAVRTAFSARNGEKAFPEPALTGPVQTPVVTDEAQASPRISRRRRLARLHALREQAGDAGQDIAPAPAEQHPQTTLKGPTPQEVHAHDETTSLVLVPRKGRVRSSATIVSFVLCVLLPTAIVAGYFLFYASNQYVSAFKFVVRDAKTAASGISQGGGLLSFLGTGASSSNPVENYMVVDYLASRQAVDILQERLGVVSLYSGADIDWVARFDKDKPIESFMNYWQRMVTASYDQVTGIGSVQVRAFSPKDSYEIASLLVSQAEKMINDVATRPQRDAIRFAEADLKRGEDRLRAIRRELNELRDTEQVIDPQSNVVAGNIQLAQTLRNSLSQMQTELSALSQQKLNADAPANQILRSRIKATKEQLAAVEGHVANQRDGANPLSRVVAKFEQLDLDRQFAEKMVQSLMQNLDQARAAALAQHVYVTAFIDPSLAKSSTYPRRFLSIFVAAFVLFLFWVLGLLIVRSVRERIT